MLTLVLDTPTLPDPCAAQKPPVSDPCAQIYLQTLALQTPVPDPCVAQSYSVRPLCGTEALGLQTPVLHTPAGYARVTC